jgi:hypothetical protein
LKVPNERKIKLIEIVENREVEIADPITVSDGFITSYKLYKIKTKKKESEDYDTVVERRFSDF